MEKLPYDKFSLVAKAHGVNPDDADAVERFFDQILDAPVETQIQILEELASHGDLGLTRRTSPERPLGTPHPDPDPTAAAELEREIREVAAANRKARGVLAVLDASSDMELQDFMQKAKGRNSAD